MDPDPMKPDREHQAGSRRSEHLAHALAAQPVRARSLLVTFFGDVVSVQPARVWLGSVIGAMSSLGLGEHLVRTACNRLARDGWLQAHRRGRRSYYRFSDYGARQYRRAARRIYAPRKPDWDGYWTLLLTHGMEATRRAQLERELGWLGFGRAGAGTLVRVGFDEDYRAVLSELGVQAPVFRAESGALGEAETDLCRRAWAVDALNEAFAQFVSRYAPLAEEAAPAPEVAFRLRLMLIHHYRRIVLTDPELPSALLPGNWSGDRARELAATLYQRWLSASDGWLTDRLELEEGAWPAMSPGARARFRDATWTRRLVALA